MGPQTLTQVPDLGMQLAFHISDAGWVVGLAAVIVGGLMLRKLVERA